MNDKKEISEKITLKDYFLSAIGAFLLILLFIVIILFVISIKQAPSRFQENYPIFNYPELDKEIIELFNYERKSFSISSDFNATVIDGNVSIVCFYCLMVKDRVILDKKETFIFDKNVENLESDCLMEKEKYFVCEFYGLNYLKTDIIKIWLGE